MLKRFRNTLKSKRGQIGEILVVVVLIILAVLGIVKYVMPMFQKNETLAKTAGDQVGQISEDAKRARFGALGSQVPAQTVINTWDTIVAARNVPSSAGTTEIAGTCTCGFSNDSTGNANGGSAGTVTYEQYTNGVGAVQIDRMGTYYVTTITYGTDGRLTAIFYNKTR